MLDMFQLSSFLCKISLQSLLSRLETQIVCEVLNKVAHCLSVNKDVVTMTWYIILKYITFSSWKELQNSKQIEWYFLCMKKILVDSIFYTFTLCSAGILIGFLGFPGFPSDFLDSHRIRNPENPPFPPWVLYYKVSNDGEIYPNIHKKYQFLGD